MVPVQVNPHLTMKIKLNRSGTSFFFTKNHLRTQITCKELVEYINGIILLIKKYLELLDLLWLCIVGGVYFTITIILIICLIADLDCKRNTGRSANVVAYSFFVRNSTEINTRVNVHS